MSKLCCNVSYLNLFDWYNFFAICTYFVTWNIEYSIIFLNSWLSKQRHKGTIILKFTFVVCCIEIYNAYMDACNEWWYKNIWSIMFYLFTTASAANQLKLTSQPPTASLSRLSTIYPDMPIPYRPNTMLGGLTKLTGTVCSYLLKNGSNFKMFLEWLHLTLLTTSRVSARSCYLTSLLTLKNVSSKEVLVRPN